MQPQGSGAPSLELPLACRCRAVWLTSSMRSFLAFLVGLGSGSLLGYFGALGGEAGKATFRRVTKTTKPPFSSDTGKSARVALVRAEDIFTQSINRVGSLAYPWKSGSASLTEQDIQVDLRAAQAAIRDESFRENVITVRIKLEEIRKWVPPNTATYIPINDLSAIETPQREAARLRQEARVEKIEDMQLAAADSGLIAAIAAHARLDELSANQ